MATALLVSRHFFLFLLLCQQHFFVSSQSFISIAMSTTLLVSSHFFISIAMTTTLFVSSHFFISIAMSTTLLVSSHFFLFLLLCQQHFLCPVTFLFLLLCQQHFLCPVTFFYFCCYGNYTSCVQLLLLLKMPTPAVRLACMGFSKTANLMSPYCRHSHFPVCISFVCSLLSYVMLISQLHSGL